MTLPTHLLDAIASAAVREGLADAVFTRLPTPIGRLLIVQGPHGVVRVGFEEDPEDVLLAGVAARLGPRIVASDRELAATRDAVEAYFAGDDESLAVPVDLQLVRSDFRRARSRRCTTTSAPATSSPTAGSRRRSAGPKAARAVGTACATNPVPLIVPCHRVVPGSGGVGSYGGGPDRKRQLLAHEGAILA